MLSDQELVNQVLAGRQDSYAELIGRWEKGVRATAAAILRDIHQTDDIVQEAFIRGYQQLGSLHDGNKFGGWIIQIARNLALSEKRKPKRFETHDNLNAFPAAGRNGQLSEEQHELLQAVMTLAPHEKEVVLLRHFEGHPVRTIAQITNRSVGTVTKQLSRAIARLREQCKERDHE